MTSAIIKIIISPLLAIYRIFILFYFFLFEFEGVRTHKPSFSRNEQAEEKRKDIERKLITERAKQEKLTELTSPPYIHHPMITPLQIMKFNSLMEKMEGAMCLDSFHNECDYEINLVIDELKKAIDEKYWKIGRDTTPDLYNKSQEYLLAQYPDLSRHAAEIITHSLGWDYH